MKSSIDDSRQSLGLFNKDWNIFKSNFTNARRNKIEDPIYNSEKTEKERYGLRNISLQGGGIKEGIFSIFRSKDLNGLKEYNRRVESGISPMKAYKETMIGCSEEARKNAVAMAKGKMTYEEATKSIKSIGSASKEASIGLKALSIAGNMLAFWAISEVITRTVSAISDYANAAKIARENAEALSSSLTESQNKYAEDSKKIEELSSRYETLSKGVNHLGQNISLSSSQYDEYKSIVQQLSDLMPDLTTRFNEQGEKIGFVSGKLKDANEEYKKYQQNQAVKFLQEGDTEGKTYQDALNNLNENLKEKESGIKNSFSFSNLESQNILQSIVDAYQNSSNGNKRNAVSDKIREISKDYDWLTISVFSALIDDGFSKVNTSTDDELNQYIESLTQRIGIFKEKYEYAGTVIRQCMAQVAASKDEYWNSLDNDGRKKVTAFLSGITTDFLGNNNLTSKESIGNFIDDLISSIAENKNGISDAFGKLFTLNVEDMDVDDARTKIQEFCTIIANVLEKSLPEVQKILGYDNFFKTASNYDRIVAYASDGNYKSAKNVTDSKGFNQADVINAMKENSINTDEEINKFKEALDGVETLKDAVKSYIGVSTEATDVTLSFKESWKTIGKSSDEDTDKKAKEAKEELLELAKAGKLTEEVFSNSSIAENFLKQTKLSAEEATQEINKLASSVDQLSSMKTGISSISSILGDKESGSDIGIETLAGMPEDIKKQKKEYEHFVEVLGDSTKGMDECEDAANRLATAYVTSGNFLANLTDENEDYYKSVLKEMGVKNAATIVEDTLTAKKQTHNLKTKALAAATEDMVKKTSKATKKFVEQADMTNLAKVELTDLIAKEQFFSKGCTLSTSEKVKELNKLAQAYFGVSNAIQISSAMGSDHRYYKNPEDYENAVQKQWNKTIKKQTKLFTKLEIDGDSKGKTGSGKGSGKGSESKSDKSKSKQQFDWISRALDRLSSRLDLVKAKYDNLFNDKKAKNSDSLLTLRNKNLEQQYKLLQKTEKYQEKAQKKYTEKANSIKLDASLKKAVREGRINSRSMEKLIAAYGEKKAENIQKYQDWYDKAQEQKKNRESTKTAKKENRIQKYQNLVDNAEEQRSLAQARKENEKTASGKNSQIKEEEGWLKESYDYQIKIAKKEKDSLKAKELQEEKEKALRDLEVERHQNLADEYQMRLDMLSAQKENLKTAAEKNDVVESEKSVTQALYAEKIAIAQREGRTDCWTAN